MRMVSVANKLGSVYGPMTWDLVEFDDPVVALSDHPVVGWPLEATPRQVVPTPVGLGALMVPRSESRSRPSLRCFLPGATRATARLLCAGVKPRLLS